MVFFELALTSLWILLTLASIKYLFAKPPSPSSVQTVIRETFARSRVLSCRFFEDFNDPSFELGEWPFELECCGISKHRDQQCNNCMFLQTTRSSRVLSVLSSSFFGGNFTKPCFEFGVAARVWHRELDFCGVFKLRKQQSTKISRSVVQDIVCSSTGNTHRARSFPPRFLQGLISLFGGF